MSNKRSLSPMSMKNIDKRPRTDLDYLKQLIEEGVSFQMKSIEQRTFKDSLCQKLIAKHEKVDENCQNWHDFAVEMQQRVKRMAMVLNRQQESIKNLKLKKQVQTADAMTQTDDVPGLPPLLIKQENGIKAPKPGVCEPKPVKKEYLPNQPKMKKITQPDDIIDLTEDDSDQITPSSKRTGLPHDVKADIRTPTNCVKTSDTFSRTRSISKSKCNNSAGTSQAMAGPVKNEVKTPSRKPSQSSAAVKREEQVPPYPPLPYPPVPPKNLPANILPAPFKPELKIRKSDDGIELSWDHSNTSMYAKMDYYELYVYQHNSNTTTNSIRWRKIKSDPIKAMTLPMACTLSQFSSKSKYYFAVRGRDVYGRYGVFSTPCCSSAIDK